MNELHIAYWLADWPEDWPRQNKICYLYGSQVLILEKCHCSHNLLHGIHHFWRGIPFGKRSDYHKYDITFIRSNSLSSSHFFTPSFSTQFFKSILLAILKLPNTKKSQHCCGRWAPESSPLSWCQSVPLSQCPGVKVSQCPGVLVSRFPSVLVSQFPRSLEIHLEVVPT